MVCICTFKQTKLVKDLFLSLACLHAPYLMKEFTQLYCFDHKITQ